MNPKNDDRWTFGQVEPTPEPAPDNPEEPNGDEEKQGTKILPNFISRMYDH